MAPSSPDDQEPLLTDPGPSPMADAPEPHLEVYRAALRRYDPDRLGEILGALGLADRPAKPSAWVDVLADRLSAPGEVARRIAGLEDAPRLALGLFALTESPSWPVAGLDGALRALGTEPAGAVLPLLGLGLLALRSGPEVHGPTDPTRLPEGNEALVAEL